MTALKALDPVLVGLSTVVVNLAGVGPGWILENDSLPFVLALFGAVGPWCGCSPSWCVTRSSSGSATTAPGAGAPPRPARWRGDRMHQRVERYQNSLDELLTTAGWARDADLAAHLRGLMFAPIPEPLPEWTADTLSRPGVGEAWEREQAGARARREHHVMTVMLMVTQLDADLDALRPVAGRDRMDRPRGRRRGPRAPRRARGATGGTGPPRGVGAADRRRGRVPPGARDDAEEARG